MTRISIACLLVGVFTVGCEDAKPKTTLTIPIVETEEPPRDDTSNEEPPPFSPPTQVDYDCEENGCIRWALFLGDYPKEELEAVLEWNINIENGYSVWQVGYWTWGQETRATFAIPYGIAPPEEGWSFAVNNPGTVGVGDSCALSKSIGAAGLAGYFGARGFWGITLDYPGLGYAGSHPYLVSEVNGRASLDAIRAATNFSERFSIPTSAKAVMAGLSQGGHTTFAAASLRRTYATELDIRAYAVAAPASVLPQHWTPYIQTPGSHLVYHALVAYAWSSYYGHSGEPIWAEGIQDSIEDIMENHCIASLSNSTLEEELGTTPEDIFSPSYLADYSNNTFERYDFLSQGFEANQVKAFEQYVPIRFYQGQLDDVVPLTDSQELVSILEEAGMSIDLVLEPAGHHTDVAFSFLGVHQLATPEAIEWLKSNL